MSDLNVTAPSTGRRPGRPRGTGYAALDRQRFPEIEALLKPQVQVESLRDAVRALDPPLAGYGTQLSIWRRCERLFRKEVST
jgi:hypothetical protein